MHLLCLHPHLTYALPALHASLSDDDTRSYFGMMTVSVFPMVALAQIVNILFLNIFFLYGGFFITYPSFPIWWKW